MRSQYKLVIMDCCRQNTTSNMYESSDSEIFPETEAIPGDNITTDEVTRGPTSNSIAEIKCPRIIAPLYGFWAHSCRSGYTTEDGEFITTMMKKFFKLLE